MLSATIRIVQVLDLFEIRCVITRFTPGEDPEQFSSTGLTVSLPEEIRKQDDLTIINELISLWSEMTIH